MNLLLLGAAIVITILVFMWLLRVVKATVKTAFLIALLIFALQLIGIGPDKVLNQIVEMGHYVWQQVGGK